VSLCWPFIQMHKARTLKFMYTDFLVIAIQKLESRPSYILLKTGTMEYFEVLHRQTRLYTEITS